jgi:hypothetical protein
MPAGAAVALILAGAIGISAITPFRAWWKLRPAINNRHVLEHGQHHVRAREGGTVPFGRHRVHAH